MSGLHLRTPDRVALIDALAALMEEEGLVAAHEDDEPAGAVRLLVAPVRGAWTSLYPEDARLGETLGPALAGALETPVLWVEDVEQVAFAYRAYGPDGTLVDRYHSCPDYAKGMDEDDASPEELADTRGEPARLAALLGVAGAETELGELLGAARIERLRDHDGVSGFADAAEPLGRFAELLGLPDLLEDFDLLWEMGLDEDPEADLRRLVYVAPREPRALERLVARLRERVDRGLARARSRAKRRAAEEEPAGGEAIDETPPPGEEDDSA